jgi:predicted nucleotidyltransferase
VPDAATVESAQQLAREAARRLRDEFDAHRVVLFGSAARSSSFTLWSDVDLAAWGLAPERFYAAVAAVTGLSTDIAVDLVDPERCPPACRRSSSERASICDRSSAPTGRLHPQ